MSSLKLGWCTSETGFNVFLKSFWFSFLVALSLQEEQPAAVQQEEVAREVGEDVARSLAEDEKTTTQLQEFME